MCIDFRLLHACFPKRFLPCTPWPNKKPESQDFYKSTYWGKNITVAGLITSEDLINTVKDINADYIIIPAIMFKAYSETFLDGKDLDYVKETF